MIKALSVSGMSEGELRRNLNISPFNRDARVYCSVCSHRGSWKLVDRVCGFLKDNKTVYQFECHGEVIIVDAGDFCKHNRVNGPTHKSYLAFEGYRRTK